MRLDHPVVVQDGVAEKCLLSRHCVSADRLTHLNAEQRNDLLSMLDEFAICFSDRPGLYTGAVHRILLQSVRVAMQHSERLACEFGVPQGSVLGPLLFTLYMSSAANVMESFGVRHMQYADDITLYVVLEDANTVPVLSDCFRAVHHWLDLNGLSLNADQTEAIVIGTSSRQAAESPVISVDLGDVSVQTSDIGCHLGRHTQFQHTR